VFLLLTWLAGWLLCFRVRVLSRSTRIARSSTRTVSVIVPARDEAGQLPKLLRALARQTASPDEVIVVDDHSHDSTAAVARTAGVEVVTAADLPHGWTGKAWASWQGAQAARGDVLVFLDADTEPEPDLVERVVAYRSRRGGLVSVQPYHRMQRPYERFSALFNVIAVMGVGTSALWRPRRVSGAFGACVTVRRDDYLAHGDHESVRGSVLEDVALARRMQAAGQPVDSVGGRGAISFRMYPRGVRQLIEGWSKNFSTGAGTTPLWRIALTFLWVAGALFAGWNAWRGAIDLVAGGSGPGAIVWVAYGAYVVQLFVMLRQVGNFGVVTALLYPIPAFAFVAIFVWSLVLMARGEVHWKGRSIPVRGARSR
jgi:4,4'-diaponeurosporenoate glycosyltransferase